MSTKKDPKKEEGPSGKEIFVGGSQKTSSEMDKKIFKDLQEEQTINIDEIMEMYIAQLEQDNNLRNKYTNDLKLLREQWEKFSATFQKLVRPDEEDRKKGSHPKG